MGTLPAMTTIPAPSQQFGSVSAQTFVGHDLILNIDTQFTAQELQALLDRMLPHLRQGEVTQSKGVLDPIFRPKGDRKFFRRFFVRRSTPLDAEVSPFIQPGDHRRGATAAKEPDP